MVRTNATMDDDGSRRDSAQRIRCAAVRLFRERGFHGTSIRQLAQAVDMESASLYYHYASKQAILVDLFHQSMDGLIEGVERVMAGEVGPIDKFRAAVLFHVRFHIDHQDEAFVSHSELRALTGAHRDAIVAKRDRYERLFRALLESGRRDGVFAVTDAAMVATALLMMCSGVSHWFGPHGRLSADNVERHYVEMAARLVGSPDPGFAWPPGEAPPFLGRSGEQGKGEPDKPLPQAP